LEKTLLLPWLSAMIGMVNGRDISGVQRKP
jgi:hypothetical protein